MTVIEVVDAARDLLNEPLDSTRTFPDNSSGFWGDTTLLRFLNIVQQDVATEIVQAFEDYFLTSTDLNIVDGTAEYTLPTNFQKARRLEDRRNVDRPMEIYPTTLNQQDDRYPVFVDLSQNAWNGGYYLRGTTLVLEDTPTFTDASAVRLYYIKTLGDMSAGSETSEVPLEHHRILVWGLVKYMQFQQQADTTLAEREYARLMRDMKRQAENRQVQRPRKVRRQTNRLRRNYP